MTRILSLALAAIAPLVAQPFIFDPQINTAAGPADLATLTEIATADFNGDGKADLAVVNQGNTSAVWVLISKGDGTFAAPVAFAGGPGRRMRVAALDIDRDGRPDLIVSDGSITVFLGNGNGTFQAAHTIATTDTCIAFAVADFNGDGAPDLVCGGIASVTFFAGRGDGTFGAGISSPVAARPFRMFAAEMNRDRRLDLVYQDDNQSGAHVLLGRGDGTFLADTYSDFGSPKSFVLFAADFNLDGAADIGSGNGVAINTGDGTLGRFTPLGAGTVTAAAADLNSDGKPDLIVTALTFTAIRALAGNGDGTFQSPVTISGGLLPGVASLAVADLDGDGRPDVVTTLNNVVSVRMNRSGPGRSITGIVNGANFQPGAQDGSWVTITGTNLSASPARTWNGATEIVNGVLPSSLDGVSVTFDGRPAAVYYVSPTQLNVQAPITNKTGPVPVRVTTPAGFADGTVTMSKYSPGLFVFDLQGRKYPAALVVDADGVVAYLGAGGRPARPGDVIELFGTGFGPTSPPVAAGVAFSGAAPADGVVTATIAGQRAAVQFAGLTGAGLYQINVVVPDVPNGDQPVVVTAGGVGTQAGVFVPVGRP